MKKLFLGLIMVFAGMVCFADVKIRHDVCGKTTVTIYWNSDYTNGPDNANWAEFHEGTRKQDGWKSMVISDFLIGSPDDNTHYVVGLLEMNNGLYNIRVYFGNGNFVEKLKDRTEFGGFDSAKYDYDELCQIYKEYVRNNYHHYK